MHILHEIVKNDLELKLFGGQSNTLGAIAPRLPPDYVPVVT